MIPGTYRILDRPVEHLDYLIGTIRPKRTDDLRDGVDAWIGSRLGWRAVWVIEDGPYQGDWACQPDWAGGPLPFAWMPLRDLDNVEVIEAVPSIEHKEAP